MSVMSKNLSIIVKIFFSLFIVTVIFLLCIYKTNVIIKEKSIKHYIYNPTSSNDLSEYDYIVVLGTTINPDNSPSYQLIDRLDKCIELYKLKPSISIVISGDDGIKNSDEITVMKDYLVSNNIPLSNIIIDGHGYSTYESVYNVKSIVGDSKIIFVSHGYHLYRILFLATEKGIKASGVPAVNNFSFYDEEYMIREFFARSKDYILNMFNYKPKNTN